MPLTQCLRADLLLSEYLGATKETARFSLECVSRSSIPAQVFHPMPGRVCLNHFLRPKQMSGPDLDSGLRKTLLRSIMAIFVSSAGLEQGATERLFRFSSHLIPRMTGRGRNHVRLRLPNQ